jgi:hypothetical protein
VALHGLATRRACDARARLPRCAISTDRKGARDIPRVPSTKECAGRMAGCPVPAGNTDL